MADDGVTAQPGTAEGAALEVSLAGAVAQVTLLGPGPGNAMGPAFWTDLPAVFTQLDADESVRAVVVTGSGANFSYGLDLKAYAGAWSAMLAQDDGLARSRTQLYDQIRRMQAALDSVAQCRKPVVAAISGWCIGGGVDLIAACDVRCCSAEAMFSVREVRIGIVADLGSLQRLPAIIGDGHLRELALTGKNITAARAAAIGLVNEVLDDPSTALAAAHGFASQCAANPPLVVQGIKQVLQAQRASRIADGLANVAAWNSAFLPSRDLNEAMNAFGERGEPGFTGR